MFRLFKKNRASRPAGLRNAQPPMSADEIAWLAGLLLFSQALHWLRLPLWVSLMSGALVCWRWSLARRGRTLGATWPLALIAAVAAVAAKIDFGVVLQRESSAALLHVLVALKFMESRTDRDRVILVALTAGTYLTLFFYYQSMLVALTMPFAAVSLVAAMLPSAPAARGGHLGQRVWAELTGPRFRYAGRLLVQGIPLAALLFLLFPRIAAPLWSLPTGGQGTTGLSDRMKPGDIRQLSLSEEVAFRVDFTGPPPAQRDLYWRGPVLSDYDGRQWSVSPHLSRSVLPDQMPPPPPGPTVTYAVTLEPHQQNWLFALDNPLGPPADARMTTGQQIVSYRPVTAQRRYELTSRLSNRRPTPIPMADRTHERRLNVPGNPRAHTFALELMKRPDVNGDPLRLVNAVLRTIREQPFAYTLSPGEYGADDIDEFFFDRRRGFCEHYAGAFTFIVRAAGVPARIVTGYQGGTMSPVGGYMIVRQSEAHAWAEVLIDNQWLRVDPTAAVAPDRIERDLRSAVPAIDRALIARLDWAWLQDLRFQWDNINFTWQKWVIGFNTERQRQFWQTLGWQRPDPYQMVAAITAIVLLWSGVLALWLLRERRRLGPVEAAWARLGRTLAKAGLPRRHNEGPFDYMRRAAVRWPSLATPLEDVGKLYAGHRYGRTADAGDAPQLVELARTISRELARQA